MKIPRPHGRLASVLRILLALVFWLMVWWIAALIYKRPFILPTPWRVLTKLFALIKEPSFYEAVGHSLLHILLGLLIGCALGMLFGVLTAFSKISDTLLSPAFSVVRATPVACFIIIAWVFVGSRALPSFISALMVAPVMLTSTATAIRQVDRRLLEAAKVYHLSPLQKARVLYLPSVLPHVRSSLVTCVGLAWKSGIATEVISMSASSIGYAIWLAKSWDMDYEAVFAWTVTIVLISLAFEKLLKCLLCPGKKGGRHGTASL